MIMGSARELINFLKRLSFSASLSLFLPYLARRCSASAEVKPFSELSTAEKPSLSAQDRISCAFKTFLFNLNGRERRKRLKKDLQQYYLPKVLHQTPEGRLSAASRSEIVGKQIG